MRSLQAKILELIDGGRSFAVATVAEAKGSVPGKPGAKMVLLPDGTQYGTVGGAGLEEKVKEHARRCLEKGAGGLFSFDLMYYKEGGLDSLCGGSVTIMVEIHRPVPHLLIAGGGHTVMLSAMRPNDPRYAALPLPEGSGVDASMLYLLCCWPVLDPYARYVYAKRAGEERLAESSEAYFLNEEAMHEGNPQEILERGEKTELPPTILIQGTNDRNVPLSIPQRFDEAYRKAGGHLELEMFQDQVHGFGNTPGAESDRAIELMKGFIAKQLSRTGAAV